MYCMEKNNLIRPYKNGVKRKACTALKEKRHIQQLGNAIS